MARPSRRDLDYAELLRRNTELTRQRDEANARIAELVTEVATLSRMVAEGNERLTELLAVVQRAQGGARRRRPKAPEPPLDLDEKAREAYLARPKAPKRPKRVKAPKKPRRPTGRKPVPEHLPAELHDLAPECCQECGGDDLEVVDVVVETKLHAVAQRQRRRVVNRTTCVCRHCGTRTTARSLPSPFARSKATCEWLAWLVHQKFVMLNPLDRLRRDLAAKGVPLAMSYLVSQVERAADLLGAVDGEHWRQLLAGEWMATDATGLKVLVPGLKGSHNGHLEVYRRDDLVVFQYEANKGSEALVSKLAPFAGTLVADAEHRHNPVFADGRVVEAGCNAHGRRKFRDAEAVQPTLAAEGGDFIANIYVAESEAHKKGLTGAALKAWRQQKMAPLRDELREWMEVVEPTLTPDDALAKVIRYYRNHWDALFRFVDDPRIPIDNSASEREYQNVAKLRLNCLFAGSTEGAHRAATLLGIAATCRALGLDTEAYLAWAFTRLGTHRDLYGLSAAELTPAAFARAQAPPDG
jgi:transposase